MKKIISTILVTVLIISASISTVFADSWKNESGHWKKGGFPPGIAKKIFSDIDKYEWAKKAIEKMQLKGLIKGYGKGIYAPSKAVSQLESVIMALRVMGWEDEAQSLYDLPNKYKGESVGNWAKGYINVAYEKGILDDVDMMYFSPNSAAKRHEVAKYVVRALGYEDEAQDSMDEDLDFVDGAAVPVGSVGYVYMVDDLGLMKGDDQDRFNPMGTLTRAEMAVLFERLDNKVDSEVDDDEYVGSIYRLYDDEIKIEVDNDVILLDVDNDVLVYDKDNDKIDYSDLKQGDEVLVQLEDNEVVYIEIIDEDEYQKIISRYTGTVIDIEDNEEITISVDKMTITFNVIDDVDVIFNNEDGDFDQIEEGDEITVVVDNRNRARKIYVDRELEDADEEEVNGILLDVDGDDTISIGEDVYSNESDTDEYDLDDDVRVYIDGNRSDLDDLEEGMEVELKLENDLVYKIYAEDNEYEVEGEIYAIVQLSDGYKITLEIDDETYTYELDEDADIEVDDDDVDVLDLDSGQDGEFTIVNNTIVEIDID